MTRLAELHTPCLVLERGVLLRNLHGMARLAADHGVALRPHMKTAKSVEVARLALGMGARGLTVSTLAEAALFASHGMADLLYAVGITPDKLQAVAALNRQGAAIRVITDDPQAADAIAACPVRVPALVEVDTGEHRGGLSPEDPGLREVAHRLGDRLAGVVTHAGHSYEGRTGADMARIARAERDGIVLAARRLREAGHKVDTVSMGSSPTAVHAPGLDGVTELRAGVYMFGDLFQAQIGTHAEADIAVSVLASVIGRRPAQHQLLVDAGALALSKDRSTAAASDCGFGLVRGLDGAASLGRAVVVRAFQEHGVVQCDPALSWPDLPIGARLRVLPNHACLTAAAHERYHVVDGADLVAEQWGRVNGW